MKATIFASILLSCVMFLFSSCSHRLVGTWNIAKYETTSPGQQGVALSNIGTMKFNRNGSGEKDIQYTIFGISKDDKLPFNWNATGSYVTIDGNNSDFAKTWIIIDNKRRSQKWKSTDGTNNVQIIELKK